ncbi:hypothetical protein DMUE_2294 [Dictyocoela muelleri]|nr:hypothetical protein DMUE_2294 [Dictyocoela muelleri]
MKKSVILLGPSNDSNDNNDSNDICDSYDSDDSDDSGDLIKNNELYLKRMERNAPDVIEIKILEIGDKVLIKKDFDFNIKTKRKKLESFYEDLFGVVSGIICEGIYIVKINESEKRYLYSQLK